VYVSRSLGLSVDLVYFCLLICVCVYVYLFVSQTLNLVALNKWGCEQQTSRVANHTVVRAAVVVRPKPFFSFHSTRAVKKIRTSQSEAAHFSTQICHQTRRQPCLRLPIKKLALADIAENFQTQTKAVKQMNCCHGCRHCITCVSALVSSFMFLSSKR